MSHDPYAPAHSSSIPPDRLMPDMTNCALKLVKHSIILSKLDFQSERIISLSFDVISCVLETGWCKWQSGRKIADEYMSKNLPSELEEISGWREDLFAARKSAFNLLGVISMSKGPRVVSISSKRKKGEKNKRKDRKSIFYRNETSASIH